jgi:pyruvate dehydrogenase E2 component (dihydrolipoamide acetyltransferase)
MIEFRLPSLGSDMDQGTLVEWRVRPGEHVSRGQVVAVVDTVKAAIDIECWHDGIVHALLTPPGSTLPVGALMAVLRSEGESAEDVERLLARASASAPGSATAKVRAVGLAPAAVPATMAQPPAPPAAPGLHPAPPAERSRISPLARRRASELGIDTAQLSGRGAMGSVTLADVEAAQQARVVEVGTPAVAAPKGTRAAEMRRVIAAAMSRSKREIPHYYLGEDIAFERAAAWLAKRNRHLPVTQRLLPAALLLKAVAQALQRYPEFNGFWRDGAFVPGAGVHLGVAVSLREGGLVAPALHDVPSLDVAALTRALLDLVKRTRAGGLRSSELGDATITVTNLGDQGVASVFGVIYPPQVALVGFGRVSERAWVTPDGVRALPVVTASLAADHRASDGHRGALLLAEIRERLQDPQGLDDAGAKKP